MSGTWAERTQIAGAGTAGSLQMFLFNYPHVVSLAAFFSMADSVYIDFLRDSSVLHRHKFEAS